VKHVFVDSGAFFALQVAQDISLEALAYDRHFREYGRFLIL
jgi:hypothetical protein